MTVRPEDQLAGVVIAVSDLSPALDFLTDRVGMRVEKIFPADAPERCTLIGHGCRVHLEPGTPLPVTLRLEVPNAASQPQTVIDGPDGLRVEFVEISPPLHLPPLQSSFSLTHAAEAWHSGRAGMHYRDLVPDRQGGAIIASHIRVPGAGPVPDYVHFHEIAFQLIFCRRGRVTVVYEDQGEPIVLEAGDCVTQPPRIRHRVLDSSDDLEVVEIGYPAEHITRADPATTLPTPSVDPSRTWDGQVFVHHRRSDAPTTTLATGVTYIDTGVAHGTHDLADVSEIDLDSSTWVSPRSATGEFVLLFALDGQGDVRIEGPTQARGCSLESGSALVVPVDHQAVISTTAHLSLLQVRVRTR